tara:strand:+ start:1573 stop:2007 length:435 start_codon:yes stop_codon:yes gene_type:complete
MNIIKKLLNNDSLFEGSRDWALLTLRVIPSFYMFYYHGMRKITNGIDTWNWLGEAVLTIFGITFGFKLFGFLAAFSEGVLSWFVFIGYKTRISSLFLILTMFFAGVYHLADGESAESAFIYMIVYLTIFLIGPGKYSLDEKNKI